jgi:hypothetical protein
MRTGLVIALMALSPLPSMPQGSTQTQVALAPFAVVNDSAATLQTVARDCLEKLAGALTTAGIHVLRREALTEKTLSKARPATLAIVGDIRREKGMIRAELKLMDVTTGDELRDYFNASANPGEIVAMGNAVAERVVKYVREKSEEARGRGLP